jgi:membrane-associated phospholipid phosphatase
VLKTVGRISVALVVCAFVLLTAFVAITKGATECIRLALSALIPFLAVSAMRLFFDLKRPYEIVPFAPFEIMRRERKEGRSFPSRHVFSAFLIGTLALPYSAVLATLVLALGAYISTERVLIGIHFPRDVIAGAIIGIISGALGILIL